MDQLCIGTYRDQDVLVLDGCRLVVPTHRRDAILLLLHAGHSRIAKTYRTATQLYFWPNMKADIEQSVANCSPCQAQRQSSPRPRMDTVNLPGEAKQPMLHTACDLFSAVGKQWLVLVDRFSGYAWTTALRRLDTKAVIQHLENWFNDFGWPKHIRTDGGPQFRSEFKEFCAARGIQHELSSPYNPESNGLAEAAVKNLKGIVLRCTEKGENIQHAIAAWRNTSRQDGSSRAQLFFGRRQRLGLPLLSCHLEENHL